MKKLSRAISGSSVLLIAVGVLTIPSVSHADNFHRGSSWELPATSYPGEGGHAAISADGRYIAFDSSRRLVAGDQDDFEFDIYRTDVLTNETVLVSVEVPGVPHATDNFLPSISADGSKITYLSGDYRMPIDATEPDGYGVFAILRDVDAGTSRRLYPSYRADSVQISGDGRWASVTLDWDADVYLTFVNTSSGASSGWIQLCYGCGSVDPAPLSFDGRYVAYEAGQVYRYDRDTDANSVFDELGKTSTVHVSKMPDQLTGFEAMNPSISGDGSRISFVAGRALAGLVTTSVLFGPPGDGVYLRDMSVPTSRLISSTSLGVPSSGSVGRRSSLSADGRFVGFSSPDPYLALGDFNPGWDVFLKEIDTGKTYLVSTAPPDGAGEPCDYLAPIVNNVGSHCARDRMEPSVSSNGRYVAYQTSLILGTTPRRLWLRDRSVDCSVICID